MSNKGDRLMYCDHVEAHGEKLFKLACKRDPEGIVAMRKYDPYITEKAQWMKIPNKSYSHLAPYPKSCSNDPTTGQFSAY